MSNYKRISDGPNQIIYKYNESNGCLGLIFAIVSLPMFLISVFNFYSFFVNGDNIGTALIFLGVGLSFASVLPIFILFGRENPSKIIFDNQSACIKLCHKNKHSVEKIAVIPYSQIEQFELRRRKEFISQKPKTVKKYFYHIYWKSKSGGIFDLCYYTNLEKAEEHLNWLKINVKLSNEYVKFGSNILPIFIEKTKYLNNPLIKWKNNFDTKYLLFAPILSGFSVVAIGTLIKFSAEGKDLFAAWIFIAFLTLVIGLLVFNFIKDRLISFGILFTYNELQFLEFKKEEMKIVKKMDINEIGDFQFNFVYHGDNNIQVLSKSQLEELKKLDSQGMEWNEVLTRLKSESNFKEIKISLNIVEKIQLEQYLKEQLSLSKSLFDSR